MTMPLITPKTKLLSLLLITFACVPCWAAPDEIPHLQVSDAEALSQTQAPEKQTLPKPSPSAISSKKPQSKSKGSKPSNRTFKPSEQISEDFSVPFPIDI